MSPMLRRLLVMLLVAEAVVGVGLVARRAWRVPPAVPDAFPDDPLLAQQLAPVATRAGRGGAADWRALGESLLGQGFYAHAERAFARAVALDPRDLDSAFGQAFCVDRTGHMEEAVALYRRCLELPEAPGEGLGRRPFVLYAIGRNLLRLEDVAGAEAAFRENEGFVPANYQLARLLFHDGRLGEAVRIVEGLLGQLPLALELHALKARILDAAGAPAEAFLARAAEERSAHLVESSFNTDYVKPFATRHGLPGALAGIERLLPPLPGDPQRDPRLLTEQVGRLEEAAGAARIPQRLTLAYLHAALADETGGADELARHLVTIDEAGDRGATRLDIEATVRERAGDAAGARTLRERAAAMAPTARLHRQLAEAAERAGDATAARIHEARQHFHLGKAEYRRNRLAEALREFRAAAALDEAHVASWYRAGEMAYHLQRPADAVAAFHRVVQLEPDHERAVRFLELLEPAAP